MFLILFFSTPSPSCYPQHPSSSPFQHLSNPFQPSRHSSHGQWLRFLTLLYDCTNELSPKYTESDREEQAVEARPTCGSRPGDIVLGGRPRVRYTITSRSCVAREQKVNRGLKWKKAEKESPGGRLYELKLLASLPPPLTTFTQPCPFAFT